jgi:hypothetical protein
MSVFESLNQCLDLCQNQSRDVELVRINCQVRLGRAFVENDDMASARAVYQRATQNTLLLFTPLRAYRTVIIEPCATLEADGEQSRLLLREVFREHLSILAPHHRIGSLDILSILVKVICTLFMLFNFLDSNDLAATADLKVGITLLRVFISLDP